MNKRKQLSAAMLVASVAFGTCSLFFSSTEVLSEQSMSKAKGSHSGGTSGGTTEGAEFDGRCAMGLAVGQVIETNCEFNWMSPDGKKYCFGSNDAKTDFLKDIDGNLAKARSYYASTGTKVKKAKAFTEGEANAAMMAVVKERSKDGFFVYTDPRTDEELKLKFEKVRVTRGMAGYGWFPNVIFQTAESPEKKYAIDFWFKPDGDKLKLMDIRIQKTPFKDGDDYYMKSRSPAAWWWLPVSEHPGDPAVVRGWHVLSAIHKHVAENTKGGIYTLKDDKTGKDVPLQFVEIHMPVRKLNEDGRYFACTDFRKAGSKTEFYDVDFWLDKKTGEIKVGSVRIHKVPVQDQENGLWYQEKRYTFDGVDFEVVK